MPNPSFQIVLTQWAANRLTQYLDHFRSISVRHHSVFKALNKVLPALRQRPFDFAIEPEISDELFTFQYISYGQIKVIYFVDTDQERVVIVELCIDV